MQPESPQAHKATDSTHVMVVGGGIAGASTAYHLARTGLRVTLAERNRLGEGMSSRAVGILTPPLRQPYQLIARDFGPEAAKNLWEFSFRSVEGLSDMLRARGDADSVELDLSGGHVLAEPHTEQLVRGAYEAMSAVGLPVRWLSAAEVRERAGGRGFCGGYVIDGGGSVDPLLAARAVARAAAAAGARLTEGLSVKEVHSCPGGFSIITDGEEIRATSVVYGAHLEGTSFLGQLGDALASVRGQAFITAPMPRQFEGAFSTDWKSNVWRQRRDGRIVVSGWRHDAWDRGYQQDAGIDRSLQTDLRSWFESFFPQLAPLQVEDEWAGTYGWTPDFLPLVGPLPGRPGEWVTTGFGGGGFAFAFEAGRAVAHAIVGDEPVPGVELLNPSRLLTHSTL